MATNNPRERWFCELVDAGLTEAIFDSSDLMAHATPEVLAANLPPDLMAKVLASALSAGKMTTDRMLETLTPEVLAHHVPHDVLWECIVGAAKRSGMSDAGGDVPAADKRRSFLRRTVARGLDTKTLSPSDILDHATPEVLAASLPNVLKAKLLAEALRADAMNPDLIVDVVGVPDLAAHLPLAVLWECVAEAGERALGGSVVGAVGALADKKKGAKSSNGSKRGAAKVKKAGRASSVGGKPAEFNDDTNVNEWAGADDFEVVEEELAAMTDQVIGDWAADEETNVGAESPGRAK